MRWKADKNITNTPYIYDKYNDRQYWSDDELFIIACILNNYESKINGLEEYIESKRWGSIPTMFDCIIDSVVVKFKRKFCSIIDRNTLRQGDGWIVETTEKFDGVKYKISLQIEEVE